MFKTTLFTAIESCDLFSINDCIIDEYVREAVSFRPIQDNRETILRIPHMGPFEHGTDHTLFVKDQEITIDENGRAVAMAFLTEKLSNTEQVTFAFYKNRVLVETDIGK